MGLRRDVSLQEAINVDKVLADSDEISLADFAGMGIIVPAGATGQVFTVYVAEAAGGTYVPLNDRLGAAIAITIAASQAYEIDPAIFAFAFAKIVAADADTTIKVVLKG